MSGTISRRKFLRILSAMLPALVMQYPPTYGQMPPEPDEPKLNINERLLFLEQDRIVTGLTIKWIKFNVDAMMKCFRGCGSFNFPPRYRL